MKKKFSFAVSVDYTNVTVLFDSLAVRKDFFFIFPPAGIGNFCAPDALHLRQDCRLQAAGRTQKDLLQSTGFRYHRTKEQGGGRS